ncbi:MAG: hypothetical protein ACLUHE_12740 [Christensenellales bacterium]
MQLVRFVSRVVGAIYAAPTLEDAFCSSFLSNVGVSDIKVLHGMKESAMNIGIWGTGVIAAKMAIPLDVWKVLRYGCVSRYRKEQRIVLLMTITVTRHMALQRIYYGTEELTWFTSQPNFPLIMITQLRAFGHGKLVLCEKPLRLKLYSEAKEMIELATEKHILLAEAMWMRYQPLASQMS